MTSEEQKEGNITKKISIRSMSLNNFKCFIQDTKIGPIDQLTGIIGPNGVGKSSIIEALSFVLGKDIIFGEKLFQYKFLKNSASQSSQVKVDLDILEDDQEIKITRIIDTQQKNTFLIDHEPIDQERYLNFLQQKNLHPFCVLNQEGKHLFTSKNSDELMEYIEIVSGSINYKKEYEEYSQKMKKIEQKIYEQNDILRQLRKDKRNAEFLVNCNENTKNLMKKLEKSEMVLFELNLMKFQKNFEELRVKIKQGNKVRDNLQELIDQKRADVFLKFKNISFEQEKYNLNKLLRNLYSKKLELEEGEAELHRVIKELENDISIHQQDLDQLQLPKKNNLENQRLQIMDKIDQLKIQKKEMKSNLTKKHSLTKNQKIQKFLGKIKKIENSILKIEETIESQNDVIRVKKEEILKLGSLSNKIYGDIREKKDQISDFQNEIFEIKEKDQQLKIEEGKLEISKKEYLDIQEQRIQLQEMKRKINRQIMVKKSNYRRNQQKIQCLDLLRKQVKGYLGQIKNVVKSRDSRYSLALGMALKSILNHLVVEKYQNSFEISDILKSHKLKQNLIILENTPGKNQESLSHLRATLDTKSHLAFDKLEILNNNNHLREYLVYYLRSTVIVENLEHALQVRQELSQGVQIITLKGDVIKTNSIESYGSRSYLPGKVLDFMEGDQDIENEQEQNLLEIDQKLNDLNEKNPELALMSLYKKKTELKRRKDKFQSLIKNYQQISKNLNKDIKMTKERLEHLEEDFNEQRKNQSRNIEEQKKLQEELSEVKGQILEKFEEFSNFEEVENFVKISKANKNEIANIDNRIAQLNLLIDSLMIDQVEKQIQNIKDKMESKRGEIEEKGKSLERVQENLKEIKREEGEMQDKVGQMDDKRINLLKQKKIEESKIENLETEYEEVKDRIMQNFGHYQKNYIQLNAYLDEQEIKGKRIDKGIKNQVVQIATQTQKIIETQKIEEICDFWEFFENVKIKKNVSLETVNKLIIKHKKETNEIVKKIQNLTANLDDQNLLEHEQEKLVSIKEQLKQQRMAIKESVSQEKELNRIFEEIGTKRSNLLKILLTPLCASINSFYKFVNQNEGAQASLIVENPFTPFKGGLIFSAVPPQKTYTIGTESLSSGESSFANLAFFMAINEIRKSPMIVLDEIDANLDFDNVIKFISSFGKYSNKKQILFISHKPFVFKHAKVLLGITKDHQTNSAVCFSLSLSS